MKAPIAKDSELLCVFDENMKKGIPPTIYWILSVMFLVALTVVGFFAPLLSRFFDWMDSWPPEVGLIVFSSPAAYILGKKLWKRIFKVRG